jgi:formate dehydrogenase subunit gamma
MPKRIRATLVGAAAFALALAIFAVTMIQLAVATGEAEAQAVRPPADAAVIENAGGSVRPPPPPEAEGVPRAPGERAPRDFRTEMPPAEAETSLATQGPNSSATLWREVRSGEAHTVSIPNERAGILVQSEGAYWIQWREADGPLIKWGLIAMGGMLAVLVLFYLMRGRIRIEHGKSGITIQRFDGLERFGHWLLAGSFILLALTGLNLLLGKEFLMPLIGKEAFATVSNAGKWVHNNVAWPFMAGLVLVFVLWVFHNMPSKHDIKWLMMAGGLFSEGVHPPSRKFNAGQKLIFWSTILLGGSVSASGIALLFPFELPMFAKTFAVLNSLGAGAVLGAPLPETLTPIQEMQYAQIWHTMVAIAMIVIIIAHIYIGSVGMEGAFDAMGSGQVDRNWAIEHHGLWVEEVEAEARSPGSKPGAAPTPAE